MDIPNSIMNFDQYWQALIWIPRSNVSHVSVKYTTSHVDLFKIYFEPEIRH